MFYYEEVLVLWQLRGWQDMELHYMAFASTCLGTTLISSAVWIARTTEQEGFDTLTFCIQYTVLRVALQAAVYVSQ